MSFNELLLTNITNITKTQKYDSGFDNILNTENTDNQESDDFGRVILDDIYLPIPNTETKYVKSINFNNKNINHIAFKENEYPIISFYTNPKTDSDIDLYNLQIYTYHYDTNIIANKILNSDEITIYKLIVLNHYLNKEEQLHLKMGISFDGIFDKLDAGYDSINNKFYVDTNSDNKIYLETKIKQYFESVSDYKTKAKNYNILHSKYKKLQDAFTKSTESLNTQISDLVVQSDSKSDKINSLKSINESAYKQIEILSTENKNLSTENIKINNLYNNLLLLLETNNLKYNDYKTEYSEEKFYHLNSEIISKTKLIETIISDTESKKKEDIYLIDQLKKNINSHQNMIKQLELENVNLNNSYQFLKKIFIRLFLLIFLFMFICIKLIVSQIVFY